MGIQIDSNTISNGVQMAKNLTQVAANLTKGNPKPPQEKPKQETTNQPHTQTVEVKVGDQGGTQKPVIIKEKPETHVHKHFPDNRELSDRECAVRELELKMDDAYRTKELEWRIRLEEEARRDRKEREEREAKERERRQEKARKSRRRAAIAMGAVGVVTVGALAYCLYTDSRNPGGKRLFIPAPKVTITAAPISAEGEVK